ncbi:MAG: universal stress protein [Candidatus Omnitrophica bacterium]|nr:universal stress protein [Candidatus Omnitrophota bacterium]
MYRKILIPLDNSSTDKVILKHIRILVRETKSALVFVHVADGVVARVQNQLNLEDSEEIKKDKAYLDGIVQEFVKEGFDVHQHLLKGEPVDGILALAKEENADLIAMATHGHRFLMDFILGSVADGLRHRASIPILMIRADHPVKKDN